MPIRLNSFFTGVGGFDLAFQNIGIDPVFYCENNPFCRSVLKKHWPSVANEADICVIDAQSLPIAEIWTAGFPCQDLSLARTPHGRNGLRGTQSGLFFELLDLVSVHTPPVVLIENVVGLLNSHKGLDFSTLVQSLTQLGYAVAWRVLNARYFGAPQSRPRVFICAWHGSPANAVRALYEDMPAPTPKNPRAGFVEESRCPYTGISVPHTSFCISATSGRHTGLDWARSYVTYPDSVRRLTPLECERLQGFPDNWTVPGKDYITPIRGFETHRYHAIGNAICVPVVEWVAKRILAIFKERAGNPVLAKQVNIASLSMEFSGRKAESMDFSKDIAQIKWKSGGCAFEDKVVHAPAAPSPVMQATSRFIDIIEKQNVHSRYFLSSNAAEGILRRVDRMGRHLFPPLDTTLRKMLAQTSENNLMPKDNAAAIHYSELANS